MVKVSHPRRRYNLSIWRYAFAHVEFESFELLVCSLINGCFIAKASLERTVKR